MVLSNDVQHLLYFGDSLSDRGRFYSLTSQVLKDPVPPASEGYAGPFSNGEVQSSYTSDLLGLQSESYAMGGAAARGTWTIKDYVTSFNQPDILLAPLDQLPQEVLATRTDLSGQVQQFLADQGAQGAEPGTAAVFFIGVNDYNSIDPAHPPADAAQFIGQVIGSIVASAQAVAAAGVEQVLLYNLPDPSFFPLELVYPPSTIELGRQLVGGHNAALISAAAQLRSGGIDAQVIDINRMAAEITADPRTFGLLPALFHAPALLGIGSRPTWNAALDRWEIANNPAAANADPERLAFFDLLHPTTATHGVLGAFAAESLRSELHFLGEGDDSLAAGDRRDLVLAGAGDDRVVGGEGDDVVLGGLGRDLVVGAGSDDILVGGAGPDTICGGDGDDVLAGSDGHDLLWGGFGGDVLIDGLGWDVLSGDGGRDAFIYTEASAIGGDDAGDGGLFLGGAGRDTLYLVLGDATRSALAADLGHGPNRVLASLGIVTRSIKSYILLDPGDDASGIATPARIEEAGLWGLA